jgi:putative copper resistance protein D
MDNLPVIVIRFALYADLMVLAGMAAFSLPRPDGQRARIRAFCPLATPSLMPSPWRWACVLSGFGMLALTACGNDRFEHLGRSMAKSCARLHRRERDRHRVARSGWQRWPSPPCRRIRHQPQSGKARYVTPRVGTSLAIATLVWTGHAGATEGWVGTVTPVEATSLHMLAAAVWLGGIAGFWADGCCSAP